MELIFAAPRIQTPPWPFTAIQTFVLGGRKRLVGRVIYGATYTQWRDGAGWWEAKGGLGDPLKYLATSN